MKRAELILIGLAVLSSVLRIFFVPGAGLAMVITFTVLGFYYMIGGFRIFSVKNKENGEKENVLPLSVFCGILVGLSVIAILFRLMSWPGSSFVLVPAILITTFLYILSVILSFTSGKKKYFRLLFYRFLVISAICSYFFLSPRDRFFNFFHRNDPELIRLWKNRMHNPADTNAHKLYDDYIYGRRN